MHLIRHDISKPCHTLRVLVLVVIMNIFLFPAARNIGRCRALRSPLETVGRTGINHIRSLHNTGSRNGGNTNSCSPLAINLVSHDDDIHESVSTMFCRDSRNYKRLYQLENMAADTDGTTSTNIISSAGRKKYNVADIGTDHGLLAMGLALTGKYDKVIGVDVSFQALDGALENFGNRMDVEFRLGNGLQALKNDEIDIICIAGMGVNTMIEILDQNSTTMTTTTVDDNNNNNDNDDNTTDLERVGCKRLVLQPTNSKPRNLILLYDWLQSKGWEITDERIEKISSRWYFSTSFELTKKNQQYTSSMNSMQLPGCKLICLDQSYSMRKEFDEYCKHHKLWIKQDQRVSDQKKKINPRESRWLEYFFDNDTDNNGIHIEQITQQTE
jgi:tRNA A22 N-methylase